MSVIEIFRHPTVDPGLILFVFVDGTRERVVPERPLSVSD